MNVERQVTFSGEDAQEFLAICFLLNYWYFNDCTKEILCFRWKTALSLVHCRHLRYRFCFVVLFFWGEGPKTKQLNISSWLSRNRINGSGAISLFEKSKGESIYLATWLLFLEYVVQRGWELQEPKILESFLYSSSLPCSL